MLLLCVVGPLAAQSFSSLKKAAPASYNATLHSILESNDTQRMREYLASNPLNVNDASSEIRKQGLGRDQIVLKMPLLYDAVNRALKGTCSAEMCQIVVDAGCNLNVPYEEKTPVYHILDFLATHRMNECETAEKLLSVFMSRTDFDVNYRHRSLMPPLAYLIRENHRHLGRFDKNYISDKILRSFIERGASINTYDAEGNSLMVFAIDTENEWLTEYFIRNGIDLAKQNTEGADALYQAIDRGNLPLVKRLLEETKTVLDEHRLQNDMSSIEKYPELYQYVAQLCADHAIKYTDIFDLQKFADRFSKLNTLPEILNRQKDLIYAEENISTLQKFAEKYPKVFNAGHIHARQVSFIEREQKNILSQIHSKSYSGAAGIDRSHIENFIALYTGNDLGNKVGMAAHTLDLMNVVSGMKDAHEAVEKHWLYEHTPTLFEEWVLDDWPKYDLYPAEPYVNSVKIAIAALDRIMVENKTPVFAEAKKTLMLLHDEFAGKYNESIQRAIKLNEEDARRRAAERQTERRADRKKRCDNCIIDIDKTKIAYNEIKKGILGKYTKYNPGEFVMKNGDKYKFYEVDGKWEVAISWFVTEKFEILDFDSLVEYFLRECENKYCY
jgi:hypothetical protein